MPRDRSAVEPRPVRRRREESVSGGLAAVFAAAGLGSVLLVPFPYLPAIAAIGLFAGVIWCAAWTVTGIVESRALRLVLAVELAASVTVAYVQVDGLSMWFLVPVASAACALLVERRVSWAVATCLAAAYAGLFFTDVDRRWFLWPSQ